ncbi:MAG: tyrosine-type recombinase/integrase [Eubacterium sp.]
MTLMLNYFDKWLVKQRKKQLKEQSLIIYKSQIENHLIPTLGSLKITEMNNDIIQKFINQLEKTKSAKTIGEIYNRLKSVLELAVNDGRIQSNPCKDIILPKKKQKRVKVLSVKEQQKLETLLKKRLKEQDIAIMFGLYMGLRVSEIAALQWQDIDFENGFIMINHSFSRIKSDDNSQKKTKHYLGEPKTESSKRKIPIPKRFQKILQRHQKTLSRLQNSGKSFVISKKNNTHYDVRTFQRHFKKCLKMANLNESYTFHILRHTFATRAVESSIDIQTVSEFMGHTKTSTTMDLYVHLSDEHKQKEIQKMDHFLMHYH